MTTQPGMPPTRVSLAVALSATALMVAGCAGTDDSGTDVDPAPLDVGDDVGEDVGNLEASPGTTSDEICAAAYAVERSADDLDATSLEAWRTLESDVQQTFDDFVALAGSEYPEAVDSFEARLTDFAQAIDDAEDDPLSGPLVLEDTAAELGVAGDLLVEALDCADPLSG
jgi:hypothetical protein